MLFADSNLQLMARTCTTSRLLDVVVVQGISVWGFAKGLLLQLDCLC
jgi:hypothetical protein